MFTCEDVEIIEIDKGGNPDLGIRSQNPMLSNDILMSLSDLFNSTIVIIRCYSKNELTYIGCFLAKLILGHKFVYCGGRFGYLGFEKINNDAKLANYIPLILKKIRDLEISSFSFCSPYHDENLVGLGEFVSHRIDYFVAPVDQSVGKEGLIFPRSVKRSNLSKCIKKSQLYNFSAFKSLDLNLLYGWYENCHLKRMQEINGKIWGFDVFEAFIRSGHAFLYVLSQKNKVLGGCFIIESRVIYELFMMSTPLETLNIYGNFYLTKEIYLDAYQNNKQLINWQASNPSDGGLVEYKLDWNCEIISFDVFCFLDRDRGIDSDFLIEHFPNQFIYPYGEL